MSQVLPYEGQRTDSPACTGGWACGPPGPCFCSGSPATKGCGALNPKDNCPIHVPLAWQTLYRVVARLFNTNDTCLATAGPILGGSATASINMTRCTPVGSPKADPAADLVRYLARGHWSFWLPESRILKSQHAHLGPAVDSSPPKVPAA